MKPKILYALLFTTICLAANAQNNTLKINSNIEMPGDSLESKTLLFSVNNFLSSIAENDQDKWVLAAQNTETQLLVDEIIDVQKNEAFQDDTFYKPYLTSVIPLENNNYEVHIAYIGIKDDTAILKASFVLIANKKEDKFLISSPLKRNTKNWKTKKLKNTVFHYPFTLDLEKAQQFHNLTSFFDEKLQNNDRETHYYLCTEGMDPLHLFGVEYKLDYNSNELNGRWETSQGNKDIFLLTDTKFYNYPHHDIWHFRLSRVMSRREVHRRVDCHIATLYGGIWGISWDELFPMFTEKYFVGKNVDWLEHKENKTHFITQERRRNYTDDFVGALLIKKIMQEKGFDGVWKLLKTKRTKDEKEYFSVLKELTGITKRNYNKEVTKLIVEEMSRNL